MTFISSEERTNWRQEAGFGCVRIESKKGRNEASFACYFGGRNILETRAKERETTQKETEKEAGWQRHGGVHEVARLGRRRTARDTIR